MVTYFVEIGMSAWIWELLRRIIYLQILLRRKTAVISSSVRKQALRWPNLQCLGTSLPLGYRLNWINLYIQTQKQNFPFVLLPFRWLHFCSSTCLKIRSFCSLWPSMQAFIILFAIMLPKQKSNKYYEVQKIVYMLSMNNRTFLDFSFSYFTNCCLAYLKNLVIVISMIPEDWSKTHLTW